MMNVVTPAVSSRLAALNEALSKIEEDGNGDRPVSHYAVESIERPKRKVIAAGVKINKRLSYVERSYNQLTNDMYSDSSLVSPTETTTTDLQEWANCK